MKNALLGLFFLIPTVLFAQNVDFKKRNFPNDPEGFNKAMMNFSKGQDLFYRGPRYYESALNYLLDANTFNPNNTDLNIIIGTVYNSLNLKGEAAEYYKKAAALDPKYKKEGMLLSAENLHLDLQWNEAIQEYNAYKNFITTETEKAGKRKREEAENEIAAINRRITQCENGKSISSDTVEIILVNLGKNVNSKYPDYSPLVTADEQKLFSPLKGLIPQEERFPPDKFIIMMIFMNPLRPMGYGLLPSKFLAKPIQKTMMLLLPSLLTAKR